MKTPHSIVLGAIALLTACAVTPPAGETPEPRLVHEVERENLRIAIHAQAELQAAVSVRLSSLVEGMARVLYLIPEGTVVSQGQVVAELDVSGLEERRATLAIAVARAEAAFEQARRGFVLMENGLEVSRDAAQGELRMATMRRETFIPSSPTPSETEIGTHAEIVNNLRELLAEEHERDPTAEVRFAGLEPALLELIGDENVMRSETGELANRVLRQMSEVKLASATLRLAADKLARSDRLSESGRIERDELERERIAFAAQLSEATLAWNDLRQLIKFTLKEQNAALLQDIHTAELMLESLVASNEMTRVEKQADLISKEAERNLATQRLDHLNRQIEAAIIRAPAPGLVVYANTGSGRDRRPVQRGMEVHERQALINLPDLTNMIAELRVAESDVAHFEPGKVVTIGVDSYPDRSFTGRVHRVSTLPVPGARTNDGAQVHGATVVIDGGNPDAALRPGMNATVEMLIEVVPNALTVPLQALERDGELTYVWKVTPDGPEIRTVEIGRSNMGRVEILEGLREGDRIYLGRPPDGDGS